MISYKIRIILEILDFLYGKLLFRYSLYYDYYEYFK